MKFVRIYVKIPIYKLFTIDIRDVKLSLFGADADNIYSV